MNASRTPHPRTMKIATDPSRGFSAVSRMSPTQQVQTQLLAAIENGEYPPGEKLPSERLLCESFGVSRVSVREALAGLAATGLIEVRQGSGAFVRRRVSDEYAGPFGLYIAANRHDLGELLLVRGALDGIAAAEAATKSTAKSRKHLESVHKKFAAAVEAEADPRTLSDLDVMFHEAIASASQGSLLPDMLEHLNSVLVESRHILFAQSGQPKRSLKDHASILEAIVSGDAATAQRRAIKHADKMRTWMDEFVAQRADTPA